MRKTFAFMALSLMAIGLHAQITETASEAIVSMGLGWNLGNTLDACSMPSAAPSEATYWGQQGLDSENYWGQPTTTSELFVMMREAGFGAIRVPVTWFNHMSADGTVDSAWMGRVKEVVDYVIDNGLYCILNVHHDTGANQGDQEHWLKASPTHFSAHQSRYEYLWQQIATTFRNYGKELLFESYNEMLDANSSWCYASMNTPEGYDASMANGAYDAINQYAQSFVNTVRATGGNNATRNLVVNTYAASNGAGSWSNHLQDPLTRMLKPTDSAEGHLLFQVHSYPSLVNSNGSNRTIADINQETDQMMTNLTHSLASKGAPVIIGEWGTSNVDASAGQTDYDVRRALMLQFAEHFVQAAKSHGIGTFYWMGMSNGHSRSVPAFNQADLAECVTKAYHGVTFEGVYPQIQELDSFVCFEGHKELGWGNGISIPADMIKAMGEHFTLQVQYKQTGSPDDMQFYLGDWSDKFSFIVDGVTYMADFNPSRVYNTPVGSIHTTDFRVDAATYQKVSIAGILLHGVGVEIQRIVLLAEPKTGLENVPQATPIHDNIYYNLLGQPVINPSHGIYIYNGEKVVLN